MDADSITLDNSTFKALASETRVAILKSLDARRKTASELAHELHATVQGISEHLHSLQQAGLVERKESGRKWVYYQLTPKGSAVLHPDSKKFWVLVSLSFLALFSYFASPYLLGESNSNAVFAQDASETQRVAITTPEGTPAPQAMAAAKTTRAGAQETSVAASDQASVESAPQAKAASSLSSNEALFLIAAAFFLAGAGWIKFVKKSA